ncbi:2-succinyl-5-enolpyruvyl-6-hydroxy-3-cyclohexene-1-carboxylic-acid synthase [Sporolactobacillus sp. THM7-4]|nr:2-succinyl-5-enolpyruvyl-6-hydroxy-3-cyclohexene-1-carboxylic-acid synthase [Sporolactobacillus sp. THM7-4]
MDHTDTLTAYLASFVDELVESGVKAAVVSPGSRSTPLAMLMAEHPGIRVYLDVDERSAGFLALGLAKATYKPVAMVCTSGTATANYYPAIVEAYYSRVPLVVLTADRPYELQDVGAPQTIHQAGMYGNHVKRFVEIDIPENDRRLVQHTRTVCARAVAAAASLPKGPVHLNFPIREPLVPNLKKAGHFRRTDHPAVRVYSGTPALSGEERRRVAEAIRGAEKGVIICGEMDSEGAEESVVRFAERIGFPVLADPLSQLRRGDHSFTNIIECYDSFLKDERVSSFLHPDLMIRFGAMPVSKPLMLWMKREKARHIVVDGGSGWRDPAGTATEMIHSEEERFCEDMMALLPENPEHSWLESWIRINQATKSVLMTIRDETVLNEEKTFLLLNDLMPDQSHLFVGNSMPIRELDTFFFTGKQKVKIFANRGANGIDGVVSTAVAVSLVREKTVLAIGDLSFFHDMNGLLAAKLHKSNLTIVLINNDGGGIFSFLAQASEKTYFETLFGTPHGLDFSHVAHLYGADYQKVINGDEFKAAITRSFEISGLKIIEVPTRREDNVKKHKELQSLVSEELSSVSGGAGK